MYKDKYSSELEINMSDEPNIKPKRKYVRKTVKNNTKKKRDKSPPYPHQTMEEYINAKRLRGEKPTEEEFRKFFEELGFKDGIIPEPEELPLDIDEPEPEPVYVPALEPVPSAQENKPKRCPRGTRKNKNGICMPNKEKEKGDVTGPELVPTLVPALEPVEALVPELEHVPSVQNNGAIPERRMSVGIGRFSGETKYEFRTENKLKRDKCSRGTLKNKKGVCVPEPTVELILPEEPEESEDKKRATKTVFNRFLDEKEKLERKHPLQHHEYLYPDLNDPSFNIKIALKKEFRDAQYDGEIKDIEKQANLLCSAKFELSPHQVFVKNFLSSDTPYKGLLLYHGLGTGKTCSAIGVAEEMRQYMKRSGLKRQIFVIASPNVQGNFRQQLFDERRLTKITNAANPNEFTWNIESCVGNSLLHEINPNSIRNLTRERLISNINSLINENYAFLGYIQFANIARAHMSLQAQEEQAIRQFFDERLIIIDEVHNIRLAEDSNRKELQQVAAVLMKVVKYARGLRLLLLSATPMFNSYKEIIWITNLLNANDGRSQIQPSDVFESDGSFTDDGEDILRRKLTGYVSYVRGENPYTFPYRLYPTVFSPENALQSFIYPRIQMNGVEIDAPIQNINVYVNRVERTKYQMQVYLSIIDYMRRKSHGFYTNAGIYREMPSFENMESFGYTLLQRPLEALNIVYPDDDFSRLLSSKDRAALYSDELFHNAVGGTGLARVVSFSAMENDEPLKHDYEYKPATLKKYGRIFSPEELPKYSAKMAEICNAIRNSEGIVLIYSQYIDGGVVPMALALEEMGFARYGHSYGGNHRHLFKKAPAAPIDAITMKPRSQMTGSAEFKPAQYIMITGDKGLSPSNTEDVKYATNADNMDGSKVKVIIISKAGSEGLDFKAIRQVHILEPWFNMNRIEQIIGRGVRNLSHCKLPFKKRNVQIYLHSTLIEGVEEEAADMYLYRLAERKAAQIGKVTRLLKENAADCILHIGQTNFTAEKLSELAANQNIRLELSSRDILSGESREVDFRIGDLSGSEICDYMSCEYQCRPNISPSKLKDAEEDMHTYTDRNLESNIYHIIGKIKELFRERHIYTLSQIRTAINVLRIYPIAQIYYVLSKFVDNRNMVLFDKYGRFGYLLNRGEYYEFQPVEITDERASVRDRSVPVEYKRSNIVLELPDRVGYTAATTTTKHKRNKAKQVDFYQVSYEETIKDIRALIDTINTTQTIKSTEMNWYKNASRALEHLHIVYDFDEDMVIKYAIYHYLDSANYITKRTLFQNVVDKTRYDINPEIESHIASYFRDSIMRTKSGDREGIYIANREDAQLIVRDLDAEEGEEEDIEWTEGDKFDAEEFVGDAAKKYMVDKKSMNDIVGYMLQFKDQDMSFYYKDIYLKRNKKGRKCDRSGGKAPIIDMLNRVVGQQRYTEENTSSLMYSGSLCVVLEMLLRKFNEEGKSGKIYYLTPEQAIQNKITDYSAS